MRRTPRRLALALLVWLAAAPLPALAQSESEPETVDLEALAKDRQAKAQRYPVNARISRYLGAAAKEVDAGNPDEARRLLHKLRPKRLNPYERVLVYRMLAYVAYGEDDTQEAIDYFKKVLDEQMLPVKDEARVRFYIAQLYASLQEWQQTVDWLNRWLVYTPEPDPLGFYLMGIAYYQLDDFDGAIEYAKKAVELSPEPKESWMRLLAALYSRHKDLDKAIPILEELVLRFPKKQYWVQLSLIYGAREDYRTALAVQQVAYVQGFLDEDKELLRLARSYLYHDLPYPAAKVLSKGLEDGSIEPNAESYELLANSWIAAREYQKSIPPLRKAAELAEDGNLYVRLGQVYMQREVWDEAATLLEKALDKGGLKDPGNAELLRGIALYNQNRVAGARSSFERARKHDSTRDAANNWLSHLDTEAKNPAG